MAAEPGEAGLRPGEERFPLALCFASLDDASLLARLNRELIEDEGHANPMTLPELEARMRGWLAGEYMCALFERAGRVVAYALYRCDRTAVHVRHLYVVRDSRRQGIATEALRILARDVWPPDASVSLDVLAGNAGGMAFYEALGFRTRSLTLEIDGTELALGRPHARP